MSRFKFALLIAAIVASFGAAGFSQAADCPNGGSPQNAAGSCDTGSNDTRCGEGTASQANVTVYAAADGAEVCSEDDADGVPLEGRVGAMQDCSCAYGDGGNDNPAPANGWARIDASGVNCGSANQPSYNSGAGSPDECG